MTGMKDREDAFEKKFAHEQQLSFELEAKCCRIFGKWIAAELGFSGADADSYAKDIVEANLEEAGFDDVIRKVQKDYGDKGLDFDEHAVKRLLDRALIEAQKEL